VHNSYNFYICYNSYNYYKPVLSLFIQREPSRPTFLKKVVSSVKKEYLLHDSLPKTKYLKPCDIKRAIYPIYCGKYKKRNSG